MIFSYITERPEGKGTPQIDKILLRDALSETRDYYCKALTSTLLINYRIIEKDSRSYLPVDIKQTTP